MADTVDVLVGTLGRPHGLRGEVTVRVLTDSPEVRFAPGTVVAVGGRRLVVASSRWHGGVLLVSFEGVADRGAAEALRGAEVWASVDADQRAVGEGEYYDRHLIGLAVLDASGTEVGRIASVLHLPAQDVLVVATGSGERMVPFVSALVPVVDLPAGHVQVVDLPGLLDEPE
mgnify:CR=1 FL=1